MNNWPLLLAGLLAGSAHAADNCEALRADIEARIRAAGVTHLSVTVLDNEQSAPGKVVGTCDLGRKKIVYEQTQPPQGSTTPMLTECRDGSTPTDGRCSR